MKVRMTVTVDVNPRAWDLNYGTGTEPGNVREDVRGWVEETVRGQLAASLGVESEVTVR